VTNSDFFVIFFSLSSSNLRLVVAHPFDQISDLQRRQMTTIGKKNHKTIVFHGGGDDLDGPIKQVTRDTEFQSKFPTCGINSYNFGRVLGLVCELITDNFRSTNCRLYGFFNQSLSAINFSEYFDLESRF
jgi:hypothetical protein